MKFVLHNIDWDTTTDNVDFYGLPKDFEMELGEDCPDYIAEGFDEDDAYEEITDLICEYFGFCINGAAYYEFC